MPEKFLIVIGGATATGKTDMAVKVATHFHTEILSADSRQFYREMNIGTAKPGQEERCLIRHHFIDSLSIEEPYSVGQFEREAIALLNQLFQTHNRVVLTGGSGLFIRAVCEGLDVFPEVPASVNTSLQQLFDKAGITALQEELKQKDPEYFQEVDIHNPQRLLRALAVCRASGRPFSSFRKGKKRNRHFQPVYILLEREREELYERINQRVDQMVGNGLVDEARNLFPRRQLNSLQTVGYQELFDHFEGEISLETAIEKIKQNTRRYAKRQLTWFRKNDHWNVFSPSELPLLLAFLEEKTSVDNNS